MSEPLRWFDKPICLDWREKEVGEMPNPFRWIAELMREMDRGLDAWSHPSLASLYRADRSAGRSRRALFVPWAPAVEILTKNGNLIIRIELPGLRLGEVDIGLSEGVLTISGEREAEPEEPDAACYLRELQHGPFRRSITLPEGILPESFEGSGRVDVELQNGILEVTLRDAAVAAEGIRIEPQSRA